MQCCCLLNACNVRRRWVNDGTALAVFSNPAQAQLALEAAGGRPRYKLRPFSEVKTLTSVAL